MSNEIENQAQEADGELNEEALMSVAGGGQKSPPVSDQGGEQRGQQPPPVSGQGGQQGGQQGGRGALGVAQGGQFAPPQGGQFTSPQGGKFAPPPAR